MAKAFKLINLVKKFPDFQLGPVSLEMEPGTVLGYIGPNGSGKTTTHHCLAGLFRADSGEIHIFGKKNLPGHAHWKGDIGFVGNVHPFYEAWTAEKNLNFLSRFYPNWSAPRAKELAGRFRLPLEKKVRALSSGNLVKLSLVSALSHAPRLLLLDEPTAGLDPIVRAEVLDTLFEVLVDGERAIFYSTHILSDISRLADNLAFLDDGRILRVASKDDLTEKWRAISFQLSGEQQAFEAAVSHRKDGTNHRVISADHGTTVEQLRGLGAGNIQETRMTIEEIAVQILKGGPYASDT